MRPNLINFLCILCNCVKRKKKEKENDDTFRHTQTINPKLIFFIYDLFKTNLNQFLPPQKNKRMDEMYEHA